MPEKEAAEKPEGEKAEAEEEQEAGAESALSPRSPLPRGGARMACVHRPCKSAGNIAKHPKHKTR